MRFSRGEIVPLSVLLVVPVFLGTASGCSALTGLGDYEDCTQDCVDVGTASDDGPVIETTHDSGGSAADDASPAGDETSVETGEPPPPDDANGGDVSSSPDTGSDARATTEDAGVDAPFDAGTEAEASAPPPATGPTCGPKGTSNRCTSNQ